jgi:PPE-repeat protein
MLWHAIPPELNTARLMAGSGPAPMLQAAAGWEALGNALDGQAQELAATLAALKEAWTGAGSERAIAAATPMVAWLQTAAQQAQQRALRAAAQAASYTKALAATPSLPEIAGNHITHAVLTATNFLGINLMPIGLNEIDYFVRMWNQAGAVMDIYQAETAANTAFEPLSPMKPILQAEVAQTAATEALGRVSETASEAASGAVRTLAAIAEDAAAPIFGGLPLEEATPYLGTVQQMAQLSGPMQQFMQPLQQLTSLAGQTGGVGDNLAGDQLGDTEVGQVGLLGASPLSNHPLAGGSGPSVGLGLMHAESLPGAAGSASRTSLMSQLIDKPPQLAPAAGAGSSAAGGIAPVGMAGQGAQAGGGSRPAQVAPAPSTDNQDANDSDDPHMLHEQDDW